MFNRASAVTASRTLRTECRHFDYACCIGKYVDSAALQGFKDSDKKQSPNIYAYFKLCQKNPFLNHKLTKKHHPWHIKRDQIYIIDSHI